MIEEKFIIHLQAIASFFMCFEYFLSEKYKDWVEVQLKEMVAEIKDGAGKKIKIQNKVFFESVPLLMVGVLSGVTYYGCLTLMSVLSSSGANPYIGLVVACVGLFSVFGFIKLLEGIAKGVIPYSLPILVRVTTSFLLYCPKGVIGGIGILFLVASFICRYINVYA